MQSKLSTSTIAQEETGLVQESSFPKKNKFFLQQQRTNQRENVIQLRTTAEKNCYTKNGIKL